MTKLFCFFILLTPISLAAQEAYKWKDSKGRVVYGSKPPKSKQNVQSFPLRKLSTYSEDKVLKRLGRQQADNQKKPNFDVSKDVKKNSSEPKNNEYLKKKDVSEIILRSALPMIKYNSDELIASCTTEVENPSDKEVFEISVAFEFPDGSLVPAVGPFNLEKGEKAIFSVPNELLPLNKKLGSELGDVDSENANKNQALPKVIIHSLSGH